MRYLSADDLEREANNLSNFSGDGGMGYIGQGDDFLEFAGGATGSFADPIHKGKIYNLTLINGSTTNIRTAVLCPGLLGNLQAGLIADGAFNDIAGGAGLTASGSPNAISYFNAFVRLYPTLVAGFKVSTANISHLSKT